MDAEFKSNTMLCLFLCFQSKKHANKVRRYFSTHIQKEPELKKIKLNTVESVSKVLPPWFLHSLQKEEYMSLFIHGGLIL